MTASRSISQTVTTACLLEVAAPKVGNVHRGADFDDLTFYDFCLAAAAIGPPLQNAADRGVGAAVLDAIEATQQVCSSNVNLGIVLLLAPLAAVPLTCELDHAAITDVLSSLTPKDASQIYQAIRLMSPGGLGKVDDMDVADPPPLDLLEAMRVAAPRDLIAQQYVESFQLVREELADQLEKDCGQFGLIQGIVRTHVASLSRRRDTLIERKCGTEVANEASRRAAQTIDAGFPGDPSYLQALGDLDSWLRSDGHRRNPGATADLIAAALFVLIRDSRLSLLDH